MATYCREQARLPLQPGADPQPRGELARPRTQRIERGRASELEALQLERLRATVERAGRAPAGRRALRGVESAGDVRRSTTWALPFTDKDDLREHYPLGLLAVPREQLRRIHASSGTGGKPTVVGYTAARPRRVVGGDGALHGDGRRAPGDGRPQRLRLRAVHRRARLPPGRRAARRDDPPGLRRRQTPRQALLLRDLQAPGAVLHAVLRAAHRPGAARGGDRRRTSSRSRSGCSAPSRGRRRCATQLEAELGLRALQHLRAVGDRRPGRRRRVPRRRAGLHVKEDHFLVEVVDPETGEPVAGRRPTASSCSRR